MRIVPVLVLCLAACSSTRAPTEAERALVTSSAALHASATAPGATSLGVTQAGMHTSASISSGVACTFSAPQAIDGGDEVTGSCTDAELQGVPLSVRGAVVRANGRVDFQFTVDGVDQGLQADFAAGWDLADRTDELDGTVDESVSVDGMTTPLVSVTFDQITIDSSGCATGGVLDASVRASVDAPLRSVKMSIGPGCGELAVTDE